MTDQFSPALLALVWEAMIPTVYVASSWTPLLYEADCVESGNTRSGMGGSSDTYGVRLPKVEFLTKSSTDLRSLAIPVAAWVAMTATECVSHLS